MSDWHVGQKVILAPGHGSREEVEIVKVGRSLVSVLHYGRERTFRMSDGRDSKHTSSTPGVAARIITSAQAAAQERQAAAQKRLTDHGVRLPTSFTVETAEAVLALLDSEIRTKEHGADR